MIETRKIDGEKRAAAVTAKAVRHALDEMITGDVWIKVKVGQGGVKRIDSEIHAVYNVTE